MTSGSFLDRQQVLPDNEQGKLKFTYIHDANR